MRAHPSLPVCIIARIDSSVSRLLVTFGDNFLSSGCAGQGMLFCPSLTVYIIAHIALGVSRLCATLYDIVRQLLGARFVPSEVPKGREGGAEDELPMAGFLR